MADSMIERIAKVLDPGDPRFGMEKARAAIAAMREPTSDMRHEGFCDQPEADCLSIWQSMIDAALKEQA